MRLHVLLLSVVACNVTPGKHSFGAAGGVATPITPSSWTVPDWFIDPVAGNDNNACTSSGTPCKTYGAITQRWGTNQPTLSQATTVTWLSDDVSTDPVYIKPTLIGNGGITIHGTLISQTTATIGTFVAPNFTAGTKGTITASGQSGAYWTPYVGKVVHDTTANATFIVDGDSGSATATITTAFPLPIVEFPTGSVILSSGDSIVIYRPSTIYCVYIDNVAIGNASSVPVNKIIDLTLQSDYQCTFGQQIFISESVVAAQLALSTQNGNSITSVCVSCYLPNELDGSLVLVGGSAKIAGNVFQNGTVLDGDVLINQRFHYGTGTVSLRRVYFGQTNDVDSPPVIFQVWQSNLPDDGRAPRVWGPGGFSVSGGATFGIAVGTATAGLLLTGPLTIDGASTAWPWASGSNAYGSAQSITPSVIDSTGGLSDPISGSKIFIVH